MTREEAIAVIRKNYPHVGFSGTEFETALRELIPELAESGDAMMEKAIVDALLSHCNSINLLSARGYQIEDVKAWLEKQKEQKPNYCHFGGDPNIERCRCCSATCSGRLADEQKLAECSEVELTFRGEKVKVKRQFFRDDKGRGYSTTEQDEDAAWYALRAWCEKKGVSLYDLYPREEWSEEDERIREIIILALIASEEELSAFYSVHNITRKECTAWLEKQKEQKPLPKFKVGDTIHCKYDDREFTIKSVDLTNMVYKYTEEGCGNDIDYTDEDFELVEQKPEWSEEDEKIRKWIISYANSEIDKLLPGDEQCTEIANKWRKVIAFLKRQKSQKDYRKLYEDIAKSKWFKKAYYGKSLGCDEDQKEKKSTATIAVYEEK